MSRDFSEAIGFYVESELSRKIYSKVFLLFALLLVSLVSFAQNVKTHIPERAFQYLPIYEKEAARIAPEIGYLPYYPALTEHESCISLKHSKCFSPTSELKTSRELGIGLAMVTKAYRKDGTLRFDKLQEMRSAYWSELQDLSWNNIKQRPDLQIRVVILLTKENWNKFFLLKDPWQRLAMTDSAYNGGAGSVQQAMRICGLKKGCDPQVWFDNVELVIPKSKEIMPGYGRSPYQINTHHVDDVMNTRYPKYKKYFDEN